MKARQSTWPPCELCGAGKDQFCTDPTGAIVLPDGLHQTRREAILAPHTETLRKAHRRQQAHPIMRSIARFTGYAIALALMIGTLTLIVAGVIWLIRWITT